MKHLKRFNEIKSYQAVDKIDESLKSLAMTGLITLSTIFGTAKPANYSNPFTPGVNHTINSFDIDSDWQAYLIELSMLLGITLVIVGIAHIPSKDRKKLEDTYYNIKDRLDNVDEPEDIKRMRSDLNSAETKSEYIECLEGMINMAQEKGFEDIVDNLNKIKTSIK